MKILNITLNFKKKISSNFENSLCFPTFKFMHCIFLEWCTIGFDDRETRLVDFTYNGRCVGMFDRSRNEEMRHFRMNWALIRNDSYEAKTRTELAFTQQEISGGFPVEGLHGTYPPRGYVATLGKYSSKVIKVLNTLKEVNWIDRLTKPLIIDTVTYNAHTNLFTRIRIVIEQPSTGNTIIHGKIRSFVLYTYVGNSGIVTLMLQFVWLIVMIYMTVKMIRGIIKQKRAYFLSNYWNILRLIGVTFAVLAAVTFVVKVVFAAKLIERVKNELGKPILTSCESTQEIL